MATLYNPKTGEPVDVKDEEALSALASGQLGMPEGSRLRVVDSEGKAGSIPFESAASALKDGYRLETGADIAKRQDEKAYGGTGGELTAGAVGVARGLSLGLSDPLARLYGARAKDLAGLQRVNPKASIAGEVAGTVAGALVPGLDEASGPALAAKLGAGVEKAALGEGAGLASRIAARAAGQAVEGGLYGLGHTLSEAAIQDKELTAEKLVAGAGIGGLIGAGAGVASTGLEAGLGKVLKFSAATPVDAAPLQKRLSEFAEERAVKAIAGNGHLKELKALDHQGKLNDVGRFALDNGILSGAPNAHQVLERSNGAVEKLGQSIGDSLKTLDSLRGVGEGVDGTSIAAKIHEKLISPLRKSGTVGDHLIADRLEKEAENVASKGVLSLGEANDFKRSFDKFLDFGVEQKPVQEGLKQIRGMVNGEMESVADSIAKRAGSTIAEDWKTAKEGYGLAAKIQDLAEKRVLQLQNNRSISLTDYIAGAAGLAHGGPGGLLAGAAGALGNKLMRERVSQVLAVGLDKLAQSKLIERMSGAFHDSISAKLSQSPELFGSYAGILANAAAHSADDLLATHVGLASKDQKYRDQMAIAGFPEETPELAQGHAMQASKLQALHDGVEAFDKKVDAAVQRFMGAQGGATPQFEPTMGESRKDRLDAYRSRFAEMERMQTSPDTMAQKLSTGELANVAPAVAATTAATAMKAWQFLHDKAPRNPRPDAIPALETPWRPTDEQLSRWGRYVDTVDNPGRVVADLRTGTVSAEQIEALQSVYPKLLQDLRQRVLEKVAGSETPLGRRQRSAMSTLMGAPIGGTGDAAKSAAIHQVQQASIALQNAKDAQAAQSMSGPPSGKPMKSTNALATMSQRLEGRGAE